MARMRALVWRLRPADRPARALPGLGELEHAVIVEAPPDDLHAHRQARAGECRIDRYRWLLGEIPRHGEADVLERMFRVVARGGSLGRKRRDRRGRRDDVVEFAEQLRGKLDYVIS